MKQQKKTQEFYVMQFDLDVNDSKIDKESSKNNQFGRLRKQKQIEKIIKPLPTSINSLESFKIKLHSPDKNQSKNIKQKSLNPNQLKVQDMSYDLSSENRSEIQFSDNNCFFLSKGMRKSQFEFLQDSPEKLMPKNSYLQVNDLLCPEIKVLLQCYKMADKIYNQLQNKESFDMFQQFLHSPLPLLENTKFMRYVFEIHLYKFQFTFHTYFEFYIRNPKGEMINLLKSEKDGLSVSSSHILYILNPQNFSQKQFTAKLKYNTMKTEYNLYDIDQKQYKNLPRNLLATIFYNKSFGEEREINAYIPKLQYKNEKFLKSQKTKNLTSYYDEQKQQDNKKIEKLKTRQIPQQSEEKIRQQFDLKNQGRRILLSNEQRVDKFYMGKKQDERYIILAAGGLTPLEIFSLAVVNLEH